MPTRRGLLAREVAVDRREHAVRGLARARRVQVEAVGLAHDRLAAVDLYGVPVPTAGDESSGTRRIQSVSARACSVARLPRDSDRRTRYARPPPLPGGRPRPECRNHAMLLSGASDLAETRAGGMAERRARRARPRCRKRIPERDRAHPAAMSWQGVYPEVVAALRAWPPAIPLGIESRRGVDGPPGARSSSRSSSLNLRSGRPHATRSQLAADVGWSGIGLPDNRAAAAGSGMCSEQRRSR